MFEFIDLLTASRQLRSADAANDRLAMCEAVFALREIADGTASDAIRQRASAEIARVRGNGLVDSEYRCLLLEAAEIALRDGRRRPRQSPRSSYAAILKSLTHLDVMANGQPDPVHRAVAVATGVLLRQFAA